MRSYIPPLLSSSSPKNFARRTVGGVLPEVFSVPPVNPGEIVQLTIAPERSTMALPIAWAWEVWDFHETGKSADLALAAVKVRDRHQVAISMDVVPGPVPQSIDLNMALRATDFPEPRAIRFEAFGRGEDALQICVSPLFPAVTSGTIYLWVHPWIQPPV